MQAKFSLQSETTLYKKTTHVSRETWVVGKAIIETKLRYKRLLLGEANSTGKLDTRLVYFLIQKNRAMS